MNNILRKIGQRILNIGHAIGVFLVSLGVAETAIFDGGKSDREFLAAIRQLNAELDEMGPAARARKRDIMRKTV